MRASKIANKQPPGRPALQGPAATGPVHFAQLNVRIRADLADRLQSFCERTRRAKVRIVEESLMTYLDDEEKA
jgi:hypothetical protein